MSFPKYGTIWPANDPLRIEIACIQRQGSWISSKGVQCGMGLFHHYKEMMSLLWPDDDHHRWSDLALKSLVENEISVFMGSSDSNKTYSAARYVLCDWWAFAENTLWMISSTEKRGAELRIWGTLKQLFNRARERYDWLPGTVLESKSCIVSEDISEDGSEGRLLTKGIIFIPCLQGSTWRGLGVYAGVKPVKDGRLGHIGDEASFMQPSFLDAYANWYGKPNFKGLLTGNPRDISDPLCVAGEPIEGWDKWHDTGKTQEWRARFYNAHVIAFDGRDSPNFDPPIKDKPKYSYMIGPKKLKAAAEYLGEDSPLWWNQCVGKPRPGMEAFKVITRQVCALNHAYEDVIWDGSGTTQIVGLDAAYSGVGGDRCVLIRGEFGKDIRGVTVLRPHPPILVPVKVSGIDPAENQIARFCKSYCDGFGITANNFFFDGRSTLAVILAQQWSDQVNAVDFGGPATDRPVSLDEYVWDGDKKTRRLKKCSEYYANFVTELWFSAYYVIISDQMRNLPRDVAAEGCKRIWAYTAGNRIQVEPKTSSVSAGGKKRVGMKERTGQSPDMFDALVTMLEGARRRGFQISKLASQDQDSQSDWFEEASRNYRQSRRDVALNYRV